MNVCKSSFWGTVYCSFISLMTLDQMHNYLPFQEKPVWLKSRFESSTIEHDAKKEDNSKTLKIVDFKGIQYLLLHNAEAGSCFSRGESKTYHFLRYMCLTGNMSPSKVYYCQNLEGLELPIKYAPNKKNQTCGCPNVEVPVPNKPPVEVVCAVLNPVVPPKSPVDVPVPPNRGPYMKKDNQYTPSQCRTARS